MMTSASLSHRLSSTVAHRYLAIPVVMCVVVIADPANPAGVTAQVMSLIDDISDELLTCRICLEPLRRPKTLTCRHTFCELCLESLRDSQLSPAGDDDVRRRTSAVSRRLVCLTCPVCYDSCPLPPGGVSRLPDDPVVTQLYNAVERRRPASAQRRSEMTCQICSTPATVGRARRSAHVKCVDCDKLMCSPCTRLHRRTNVRTSTLNTHSLATAAM